jgi:K319-like protein
LKQIKLLLINILLAGVLLTSCNKMCNIVPAIIVDAGPDQTIQLPKDTANLIGTVKQGYSSTLIYSWTELSGPVNTNPVIINSSSIATRVTGLDSVGVYVFQFAATSSNGTLIGLDTMKINVTYTTVTIQQDSLSIEYLVNDLSNVSGLNPQLDMGAWTLGGTPIVFRDFLKFDLTSIPSTAIITNATLYLYSIKSNPLGGNLVDAQYGSADACYIRRVTSSYTGAIIWSTQPSTTAINEAVIPQSTSSFEDETINITSLLQDIIINGNNGFGFQMQNEVYYNFRQFGSIWNSDATLRPTLVVVYH